MKVLVCVKQIPEIEAATVDAAGRVRCGAAARRRLEMYGEHALEAALRVFADPGAGRVDAITVGPPAAREALERALGMGATHGIHVRVADDEAASEPASVAAMIAAVVAGGGYDLVLCGVMSEDRLQGQVGPRLAARLGWPWVTNAVDGTPHDDGRRIEVARELDGGWHERLAVDLPAVLTWQTGASTPRYPRVSRLLAAREYAFEALDAASLDRPPARVERRGLARPERRRAGRVLTGTPREQAAELVDLFRQRGLLKGRDQ